MIAPECRFTPRCPGCPSIGVAYPEQLAAKRQKLTESLEPWASLASLEVRATIGADSLLGYRTRVKLAVAPDARIGLYARGTHEVVNIPGCPVMAPSLGRAVESVREAMLDPGLLRDALLAVDLRQALSPAGERVLVTLVLDEARSGSDAEQSRAARDLMRRSSEIAGVAVSSSKRGYAQLLGSTPAVVAGADHVMDKVGGVPHPATHGAFVQAHRGQAARLHTAIAAALGEVLGGLEGRRVLDLYGGSGAIGLALARAGAKVTLVESFVPAAEAARSAGLDVVAGTAQSIAAVDPPDAVVVNPPRRGLDPKTRRSIARLRPRAVAYVSCNPDTLARDLADLSRFGLRATELVPIDMIPLSNQVEVLAVLRPDQPEDVTVLLEVGNLCAVDKRAHEPTTPQGEHDTSLLDRVRRRPGWERAVPLHRLDIETSGVCLFARDGPAAGQLQQNLARADKTYLGLVRGVTQPRGVVNRPLDDAGHQRPSRTRYERRAVISGHSLLLVRPDAGRKHQVRRHLAQIGHPLVGDRRYGHAPTNRHFEERHGLDRCFLHLQRIDLELDEGRASVESPLSPDLAVLTRKLEDGAERWEPPPFLLG